MKILILMLIVGSAAYAQHGHGSSGAGHAGCTSLGTPSPVGSIHGNGGDAQRPTELGKVSHQSPDTILARDTKLSSKLDGLLPAGTTAQQACSGFKNLGDCISVIHVSHNLGIPFAILKSKLTGSTGQRLGQAIHDLKPEVNAEAEAKKAQKEAKNNIARLPNQ
jgi:hypothetical protein